MPTPVLVVIGGLPATGKTTIARIVARALNAAYLRIDTIESAILRSEGRSELLRGDEGYAVGYAVTADQLDLGRDVVAECVNPLGITRDAWRDTGLRSGAQVVEVELVCSDKREHRRRLQNRTLDIDDLKNPTWQQVLDRECEPWSRDHLIVDTSVIPPEDAAQMILTAVDQCRASVPCQDQVHPASSGRPIC